MALEQTYGRKWQSSEPFYAPKRQKIPLAALGKYLMSMPEGPEKFAIILSQETKRLLAMDWYERRALLRRNSAIRALDEARLLIL
jgi:hypothetical protein